MDAGNDLTDEVVPEFNATKPLTFAQYFALFCADSGWEIGVNEIPANVRTLTFSGEQSSYDRMNSVAKEFGVEIYYSFQIEGTTPKHLYLNVVHQRGADKGVTLRVGSELNKIETTSDSTGLLTSIYARGATPDGANSPITLKGYKWTDPDGRYVLYSDGTLLDTVANRSYSRLRKKSTPDPHGSYLNQWRDYEATTQADLLQSALSDLKQYAAPVVNYTVDFAFIPDNISIGDTIHVADEKRNLYVSARVLELSRCYSSPSSSTATLGDYLIEANAIDPQLVDIANTVKALAAAPKYYPWTRYADDDAGTGMTALPAGKSYMAVVWGKASTPSDDPADYAGHWQKVKGDDGIGVVGPKGDDGRTSYFHTAYADDVNGGGMSQSPEGKTYIGTYSDFTLADSPNPADYNWALFKGEDGDVGPKGADGLPGKSGADGRTTYAHFAYANSQDGNTDFSTTDPNRKYIGFYSNFSSGDSTNPSDYKWSLIKGADGADGKDGVPGKAGADGKTPYFHIAYSDSSDGNTNFSLDTPGSRKYIGSYTDFTQADSTNPASYSWQLVQGPKGDTGKDGVAGKDGVGIKSTQIMYAQSTSGTTAPTTGWTAQVPTLIKGQYLWAQTTWLYTDNTGEAGYTVSYNAKDGNNGTNGIAGKDGTGIKSTVIEYSVSSNGVTKPTTGWSTAIPSIAPGQFMWTRTTWSYTDGTNESGYSVAKAGDTGPKGDTGDTGPAGKDITSYASGAVLPTTVAPANSQFWVTNSNNVATAFYKSDGTKWVKTEISASAINAATFNGLTFNGVIFNGSQFISTFKSAPVDESDFADVTDPTGQIMLTKGTGTTKMGDGYLTVDGTIDGSSGDSLQTFHTEVGPAGYLSRLYTGGTAESNITAASQLYLGQLLLSNLDTSGKRVSGFLDGEMLQQLDKIGTLAWSGALYPSASDRANCSIPLDHTHTGWLIRWSYYAGGNQNNYYNYTLLPNIVNSGKTNNLYVTISMPGVGTFFKRLWWDNTGITGSADNVAGSQAPHAVMDAIFAV